MERLFSKGDIALIEKDAETGFENYYDTLFGTGDASERTIMTISKTKNLIFVKGNDDTGFDHLRDRHTSYSFHDYWKINEEGLQKLDNPSKFHSHMMPIIDYVKIADWIYSPANINREKNRRPQLFDMYTGTYTFKDQKEKYHLLVYKDTKVVHTLYPNGKKQNPPNRTIYAKGPASRQFVHPPGYNDLRLPYLNVKELPVYSLLLRKFLPEQIERFFIVVHDQSGADRDFYVLGSRRMNGMEQFDREDMAMFQNSDLSVYERMINEIDRHGEIRSREVPKVDGSFFDKSSNNACFITSFELNGVCGKATVKERIVDGYLYYDVSAVEFGGDPKVDFDFNRQFSILPAFLIDTGQSVWLEEGGDQVSVVASAIGESILRSKMGDK